MVVRDQVSGVGEQGGLRAAGQGRRGEEWQDKEGGVKRGGVREVQRRDEERQH